jgi:hypothetical protein
MGRRVPGTAGLAGVDRWDNIMEQILPPPHRAAAGSSVYVQHYRGQRDQIPVRSRRRAYAGALTSGLSWRAIFFLNLPAGLVALALLARAPRSPLRAAPSRCSAP